MGRRSGSGGGKGWLWIIGLMILFGTGIGKFFLGLAGLAVFGAAAAIIYGIVKNNQESGEYSRERKTVNTSTGRSSDRIKNTAEANRAQNVVIDLPEIDPADQAILTEARKVMNEIRTLAARVNFTEIRNAANLVVGGIERVLNALRQEPEEIRDAQLYLQYTLPTASGMLKKYWQMESSGIATPELTYKVLAYLREVKTMSDKELNAIFEDDVANIDAELEVLRQSYEEMGI